MKLSMIICLCLKSLFRFLLVLMFINVLLICRFISTKSNQPMSVGMIPAGMTYGQFMQDRLYAAKVTKPSRCGIGMLSFYALTVPFYSVLYTHVGLHPDGFLAKVTARDPNIPKKAQDTPWFGVPDLWWSVVERLSWSSLARPGPGCNLGPVGQFQK